jgi:hypothetical protein
MATAILLDHGTPAIAVPRECPSRDKSAAAQASAPAAEPHGPWRDKLSFQCGSEIMQHVKRAVVAATLFGAALGIGSADAAPLGPGLAPSPALTRVEYRTHYPCMPWSSTWGIPGCEGHDLGLGSQPVVSCRLVERRHRVRQVCRPLPSYPGRLSAAY